MLSIEWNNIEALLEDYVTCAAYAGPIVANGDSKGP